MQLPATQSYEGLVGARWSEHGVFVTSPNMKVLSPPLLGPQKIRERLQYHFGEHDPCLVAQPFDASTAFLSVIQYPYGVNASSLILWAVPDQIEFEPVLGQTLAHNPLGHLKRQLVDELESYYLMLWSDCSTALPASSDVSESSAQSSLSRARPKLNDYQTRIRILLSQLKRPLLFNEAIHSWVCAQRNILQMEALYTWVTSVEPRWDTPSPIAKHAIRDVVGALTERADESEKLFRVRIPVWYFQKLGAEDFTRVARWSTETNPVPFRQLDPRVSLADADPPHPTIFHGTLEHSKRYTAMAECIWRQVYPSSLWSSNNTHSNVQFDNSSSASHTAPKKLDAAPPAGSSGSSFSGSRARTAAAERSHSSVSDSHTRPKPRKPYSKPWQEPQSIRNKFLHVVSSIMPNPIEVWDEASEYVGFNFNHSQAGRTGVKRGYVLPEPAIFATAPDSATTQQYFANYLRLCETLIYRLHKVGPVHFLYSPTQWRSLLSIGLRADSRPGTKAAQNRNVVQSIIESSNADMEAGVHIDLAKLEELPIHWDNKLLHLPIPDSICREILNDIFFVSFSSELIMADEFFYEIKGSIDKEGEDEMEGITCEARKIKVLNKISTFVHDNELGFGSANLSLRQSTAYGLYEIMRGWTRTRSMSLQSTAIMSRLAGPETASATEVENAEFHVAYHYIISFAKFFKRAPVIPHRC
ncbi:hypothetical protein DFH05DRAFT_1526063 [Lentinula detonsa]|uniref:Uncharacterized protein n=1 Tax=Lentinula detonsa TaxID=2804962 RepID=A0A9W8NZ47_9AGAR|nr:hypothetical protein DFH05DRAFT_1526063 [Lentinula detonsa]